MVYVNGLLQIGSAVAAFIAAWLWFRSAKHPAPKMTYDEIDDVTKWLDDAATLNRRAAVAAGMSAFLAGIGAIVHT
jgi:hypothetical protein